MLSMQTLQAVIFPHTHVTDVELKRILSFFDKALLFQPWFMEKPPSLAEDFPNMVGVERPQVNLKPKQDFHRLLADYRQWARAHTHRSLAPIEALARGGSDSDPHTWDIRGMIRNTGKPAEEDWTARALKAHLILHLAEEWEEEQRGAENLLKSMENLASPLECAVEEQLPGFSERLPRIGSDFLHSENRLVQVLEAWFALFGDKVRTRNPFITSNPRVTEWVRDTWEEYSQEKENRPKSVSLVTPDLSMLSARTLPEKRKDLFAGLAGARAAVAAFFHNPGTALPKVEPCSVPENQGGCLRWTFTAFPQLEAGRFPDRYAVVREVSGKTLVLVEEANGR